MGGEPLLNPEWPTFFEAARRELPYARIQVVTNGLLILRIDGNLLDKMRNMNIEFDITQYRPTNKVINDIIEKLDKYNVKYHLSNVVEVFFDRNNYKGDSDKNDSFKNCTSRGCHFLSNGKISVCPRPFTFNRVATEYNISKEILASDIVDIYDSGINGEYIINKFKKPANTCKYCMSQEKLKYFDWQSQCEKM